MIQLEHVTKTFDTVHAVRDVSLTVAQGQIHGIIGFSGAGKSTLIRCMNLLERPDSGKVVVDGVNLLELSDKQLRQARQNIGMIFQHFNLYRSKTVYDNIAFPLVHLGWSKSDIASRVDELLKLVDLTDKAKAYPSQLSGGQKQRVAIARAIASRPKVLLCDEATSALDPQTTHSILSLLQKINQQLNITIVLITHEMAVVKAICHSLSVMEEGKIVEEGSLVDVFMSPKQVVTKNFIQSTSGLSKLYELVEEGHSLVQLADNQVLVQLDYVSSHTSEALISKLSRDCQVDCSIIFGNVELLQGAPFGQLVTIFTGQPDRVKQALDLCRNNEVQVSVLKTGGLHHELVS